MSAAHSDMVKIPILSDSLSDEFQGSVSQRLSISERLFYGLEVKSDPALPGGVLLPRRDSSTLHPELSLISSALQFQTDSGVVLCLGDNNKPQISECP